MTRSTFWLRRRKDNLRRFADFLIILPWALPGTVVALSMVESFLRVLAGTVILLPFVYFVRNVPLVVRAIDASFFAQIDPPSKKQRPRCGSTSCVHDPAGSCCRGDARRIAGSLLAFITALGEFVSSIVVYVYSNRPISIEILSQLRQFKLGTASAYGVLLIIISPYVACRRTS